MGPRCLCNEDFRPVGSLTRKLGLDVGGTQTGPGSHSSLDCLKENGPGQQIDKGTAEKLVLTPVSQTGSS